MLIPSVRQLGHAPLFLAAALLGALLREGPLDAAQPSPVLVTYSFGDNNIATGPDTIAVFQNASGSVRLANEFRVSGYHSVEIRDVPGDGDFPELQGYFPERHSGWLVVHFAFLTTDPSQELNIALAGPQGFRLARDGIALWLSVRDGLLWHTSDSIPKRLLPLRPFIWYFVDIDYDIDHGRYRLRLSEEGDDKPAIALDNQANAAAAPGSSVNLFSFIGDYGEDTSAVTYYVDDVVIGVDQDLVLPPFVAPGRRRLFIDQWSDYRELALRRHSCLPSTGLGDLGLTDSDLERLRASGKGRALERALGGAATDGNEPKLVAIANYTAGCAALARGQAGAALAQLQKAADAVPEAPLYRLLEALALLELNRIEQAEAVLREVQAGLHGDPRWAVASAMLAMRRGDATSAEASLATGANLAASELLAEEFFFLRMWEGKWLEARRFAETAEARLGLSPPSVSRWRERQADAAFQARDLAGAQKLYEASAVGAEVPQRLTLKLADVHFLLGDRAGERKLREAIYGHLREQRRSPPSLSSRDTAYLDHFYSLVVAATRAKQLLLTELAGNADWDVALSRYQATVTAAQQVLRSEAAPAGLGAFRDDVVAALGLQGDFFAQAIATRRSGEPYSAIWGAPEGRRASAHLMAAFRGLVARYPGMDQAARDLSYHRLCALDLY